MEGGEGGRGRRRRRRRRRGLRLSKIFTFSCLKSSFNESHSQIGLPGFSREAFINNPDSLQNRHDYSSNYVSTTKYNILTFFPKSLYEQFRRVANLYFLIAASLSFTELSPFSPLSVVSPLVVVIGATMLKEAAEDWGRYQLDKEVNNRKIKVHIGGGVFGDTEWKRLRVGDVVKVEKDSFFPADLLLLSSSYDDGICYAETMNLDGETNLKLKHAVEATCTDFQEDSAFRSSSSMVVRCEDPNANLYTFVGNIDYKSTLHALSPQQLLLRDSKLRNTEFVYGAVIFSGHDTKVMQNEIELLSKRSKIEKKMDKVIYLLLSILVFISGFGSIFFGFDTENDVDGSSDGDKSKRWYLRPDKTTIYYDPEGPEAAAALHFVSAMVLYGYFIPISLYVTIEIVKILQSIFINQDREMYDDVSDKPAHARTSNLNEELGQVDTILSDKTGTLTSNSMEFIKCSIAGTAYGHGITEVERSLSSARKNPDVTEVIGNVAEFPAIKGFNFVDDRILDGNWVNQPHSDNIQMFFRVLATCHTAIPDLDASTNKISYEAESPDEAAFVIAGRELGFEFYNRTQTSISIFELDPLVPSNKVQRSYDLLNILEFNSSRRRMSVIVRCPEGKLLLLSKGADSVMFELLAGNGREFEGRTREHINKYAEDGLRTLVLAYRELDEKEYTDFNKVFQEGKSSIATDREEKIEAAAKLIEKNLILLGATAVEDRLQIGVPECIDSLSRAGIKIWVLTGDKMETAINIGFACSLLRQGMEQIKITLDSEDKGLNASKKSIKNQISKGLNAVQSRGYGEVWALIIDGSSLEFALKDDDMKKSFFKLAIGCASVICCRSSPIQKALVTRLVKSENRKTTLAIGDGANDVGMLKEADIGVGISGLEGMQAVMASDVAIAQFRFLERLLLVHGHWCYRRISSMICYFFYKNVTFGFTLFLFEAFASFSGQAAYNDWFLSLYNVFFTSLPVIALGVFDQDVSARHCLKFPILYQQGVQNTLFSWIRILGWMLNGVINAVAIFFLCTTSLLQTKAFREAGEPPDMQITGATMYTCVVWVVNLQMALFVRYFTMVHHIFIWGGILLWYLFLLAYGAITPNISTTGFMVFVESCATSPYYWMTTLLVVTTTLIPYFAYSVVQTWFFPMYHEKIQFMRRFIGDSRNLEVEHTHTKVGCTARLEAKLSKIGHRVHHALHAPLF